MGAKLDSLIRFQKWELDAKRRDLAALEEERDQITGNIDQLIAEFEAEKAHAGHEAATLMMGAYAVGVDIRRQALDEALEAKEKEVQAMRDEVTHAYQELKTYEVAHDNRLKEEQKELARQEGLMLDEQGMQSFIRGQGE